VVHGRHREPSGRGRAEPTGRRHRLAPRDRDPKGQDGRGRRRRARCPPPGITGPGIYRHLPNKHALLIAIFDRVLDELSAGADRILSESRDDLDALRSLVDFHTTFVLTDRSMISASVPTSTSG
jgi:hypothetical protein